MANKHEEDLESGAKTAIDSETWKIWVWDAWNSPEGEGMPVTHGARRCDANAVRGDFADGSKHGDEGVFLDAEGAGVQGKLGTAEEGEPRGDLKIPDREDPFEDLAEGPGDEAAMRARQVLSVSRQGRLERGIPYAHDENSRNGRRVLAKVEEHLSTRDDHGQGDSNKPDAERESC